MTPKYAEIEGIAEDIRRVFGESVKVNVEYDNMFLNAVIVAEFESGVMVDCENFISINIMGKCDSMDVSTSGGKLKFSFSFNDVLKRFG